jgi:hypothetical protein
MDYDGGEPLIEAGLTAGFSWVVEEYPTTDLAYLLVGKEHRWFYATERAISAELTVRVNYVCADENHSFIRVGFQTCRNVPGLLTLIQAIREVAKQAARGVT